MVNSNLGHILYRFRDNCDESSKSRRFLPTTTWLGPISYKIWYKKARSVGCRRWKLLYTRPPK